MFIISPFGGESGCGRGRRSGGGGVREAGIGCATYRGINHTVRLHESGLVQL